MKPTHILLCNPHPIIRGSLRLLLEREPGFRVIGEAANGREAVVLAEHAHPDVVLLDITLPHINGIAAAREIRSKNRNMGILFVTEHVDEEYVCEAFKAGARGYVLADSAQSDLIRAVRMLARGGRFLSPSITSQLLEACAREHGPEHQRLSEHEKQLFCLLAEGCDDREIAQQLKTSIEQVRSDFQDIKSMLQQVGMPEPIRQSIEGLARHCAQGPI